LRVCGSKQIELPLELLSLPLLLIHLGLGLLEGLATGGPGSIGLSHVLHQWFKACLPIEKHPLGASPKEVVVGVLAMDTDEALAQGLELAEACRLPIGPGPGAP
jgi:hypothetical protein